jgi:hypothetical protein
VVKPEGRYKTNYVDAEHGLPILSGGQLLESRPINLRFIAPQALKHIARYALSPGWLAFPADGRAEEQLGEPVVVTSDRAGWLASGHVARIVPKPNISPGLLYMALRTDHAQMQIKAFACGSVVDATYPAEVETIVLPPLSDSCVLNPDALWDGFATAQRLEDEAIEMLEHALSVYTYR